MVSKKPQMQAYNAPDRTRLELRRRQERQRRQPGQHRRTGESGLAYRLVLDHEDEDYWRNFGTHRESLVAPSLAWYGDRTTLQFAYEHREFLSPFDRGTAIDPLTNHPLDIPAERRLDEAVQ